MTELPPGASEQVETVFVPCASCRTLLRNVPLDSVCPTCGLPASVSAARANRVPRVLAIAIVAMGALGALAMLVVLLLPGGAMIPSIGLEDLILLPICFLIGGVVGVFSATLVVPCLIRTDLGRSVPFVYGLSAIVVVWYAVIGGVGSGYFPLDCAVPAFISVCMLVVAARIFLPPFRIPGPQECAKCGYDLRGNQSGVCPECGTAADQFRPWMTQTYDTEGAFREVMRVVVWTGVAAIALASGRWILCDSLYANGWAQSFAYATFGGPFIGVLCVPLLLLLGGIPAAICSRRWTGAALIMPLIVVPIMYSSWHGVSYAAILGAGCVGFGAATILTVAFFRRFSGAPPFPRSVRAFREGLATELRCHPRWLILAVLLVVIPVCFAFASRARRTEAELKAMVDSGALVGLSVDAAAELLRVPASGGFSSNEMEFGFDYLSSAISFDTFYIQMEVEDGVITEASWTYEE